MVKEHKFNCSSKVLFDIIVTETMKQYQKSFSDAKIGFKYEKELTNALGKKQVVTQTIEEIVEDEKLVILTQTPFDQYTITYELVGEDEVTLRYEEKYMSTKTLRNINQIVMGFIYKRKINKKIEHLFSGLESLIQSS